MRDWLIYWRGRNRLRSGYCPECYSSPPDPDCPICDGWHRYGPGLPEYRRTQWRRLWDLCFGRTDPW